MAKLFYRYGAMNCGKSTALQQVAYNYSERGMQAFIMKPRTDTKKKGMIVSRLGIKLKAHLVIENDDNLWEFVVNRLKDHGPIDCILIDEAQFLTRNHVDQLFKIAVISDIPVICYGLRTDFQLNGFEGSARLLLLAHSIEELKTICKCGRKAIANGRKVNGQFVFQGDQVAIEGENEVTYESLCGQCYFSILEKSGS